MPSSKSRKRSVRRGEPNGGRAWELRLYVAGQTSRSLAAIRNLEQICEEHLGGRYHIEVIDLVKNPRLARDDHAPGIAHRPLTRPDALEHLFLGSATER